MHDILIALSVSFMAFVSTSMDNLFLLITYTLHPKYGIAKVRAGYLLAVLIMLGPYRSLDRSDPYCHRPL